MLYAFNPFIFLLNCLFHFVLQFHQVSSPYQCVHDLLNCLFHFVLQFHQVSSPYQCVHDTSKTLCSATRQEFDDTCYSVAPTPQSYECYQLQANEVCWDEPKSVPQNCESPTRPSVPVA
eukprot:GHVT01088360.1.p1 GENE.GHVT01088360.1~~GHVT01088360.1.p1  ORF type:complete len:119 (-),score=14.97 GHVT01088360.1:15-371(-)